MYIAPLYYAISFYGPYELAGLVFAGFVIGVILCWVLGFIAYPSLEEDQDE